MDTVVLASLLIVSVAGWIYNRIQFLILCSYLVKKEVPMPSEKEWEENLRFVLSHIFRG